MGVPNLGSQTQGTKIEVQEFGSKLGSKIGVQKSGSKNWGPKIGQRGRDILKNGSLADPQWFSGSKTVITGHKQP